jgi:TatD DNase family protein
MLVDTHCHIHESAYSLDPDEALARARTADVKKMICVGTDEKSSNEAVLFAGDREDVWASLGVHPHEAKDGVAVVDRLRSLASDPKVVAIGECGLDYFYTHSPKNDQIMILRAQIELALEHDLPMIFHVREAFDDFWPVFDSYTGLRGVLHSFTDTKANLDKALERNLYIGVNGISTFTKSDIQREMFAGIPLQNLLLETDSPFLTPVPKRGTVNEPAFVTHVAKFLSDLRLEPLRELSEATSQNATNLFHLT